LDAKLVDSGSAAVAIVGPEDAGLDWLHHSDLTNEFDISRYLGTLVDEVATEGPQPPRNVAPVPSVSRPRSGVDQLNDASIVVPFASAWAT